MTKKRIKKIASNIIKSSHKDEPIVYKLLHSSMTHQEKINYNLCSMISKLLYKYKLDENCVIDLTNEDIKRIEHRHYDYFEEYQLIKIYNDIAAICSINPYKSDKEINQVLAA